MQVSNLMKIIVSAIIGVVVFAAILVPVVGEATTTEKTFTNEGVYYIVDDSESHTLALADEVITIDGATLEVPAGKEYTILATDDLLVRSRADGVSLQFRGALSATVTACSLTIANGTVTGTYNTSSSISQSYTSYVLATPENEADIMKGYTGTAYLNGDSEIAGRGLTQIYTTTDKSTSVYLYLQIDGTINDGATVTLDSAFTVSNIVVNATAVDGYEDLYTFTSITFDVTHTESGAVTSCTYSAVILPEEVTAELSVHPDASQIALINIIPLLVLVGLVLGVVGAVLARRD